MGRRVFIVVYSISLLILAGCKTMYVPNMQNVPMFKDKGEVILSSTFSNYQLAYNPISNLGILFNGQYYDRKIPTLDDGKSGNYKGYGHLIEGGLGYLKKMEDNTRIEIYAGYGQGYGRISFWETWSTGSGGESRYNKYFFQPVFILNSGNFETALSARFSSLQFYDFVDFSGKSLKSKQPTFVEPAITVRAELLRGLSFKGQMQCSLSVDNTGNTFNSYLPYRNILQGFIGVELRLSPKKSN
jgi:hypothetical protein